MPVATVSPLLSAAADAIWLLLANGYLLSCLTVKTSLTTTAMSSFGAI